MTGSHIEFVADHSVLLAIPAFAPAFAVVGVIIYVAMRDRRDGDGAHSEETDVNSQDGSP